ncbi:cation:proton antiporter [Sporolactobacillus terrae]|uniref:Cation:proton antiporter n=1 Tax=Sporolactobacillus terrae TaxID=269673 RepID=A0ABX5Q443_9BACL|nr:cation:proton antiporter [Sporolactobacillus terrae]QAA21409.1 cation:proton antiporter [Sporolactobacillus terrae]QAA24381.1 cation:proton antiporter [Sporolactobacillus terrae]UAK16206.1 cation:proton antiporter [Sporolactobacillus terrae]
MHFILELAIILIATKLAGHVSVLLKQPAVLGELVVGIVIGPALLGWIPNSDTIHLLSEVGVILLMFIAGLETDLDGLRQNARPSSAAAIGGIIFPLGFGYLAGLILGMDLAHAVFLGLILSATSVSITVQSLKEMGKLQTRESTTILGAAVLDDILVIILLAFAMSFFGESDQSTLLVIGEKVLFFASIILISWKGLPMVMSWFGKMKVSEPLLSGALILCLLFAYYADLLGVAGIIGAFIAGAAIAQTQYSKTIEHKIEPVAYGVFVPIFFVSIGLNVSFSGLNEQIWFIVAISLLAVFSKLAGSGIGAYLTGFDFHGSARVGAGMISRGEVALILAKIGLDAKLLAEEFFTPLIVVVMVTTLVTPPLLKVLFENEHTQVNTTEK